MPESIQSKKINAILFFYNYYLKSISEIKSFRNLNLKNIYFFHLDRIKGNNSIQIYH